HSQGGIVGGKVATKDAAVDKLILMASTGVKLKKVIHFQVRRALAQNGFSQKQIEKEFAARQELYEALKQQKNVKEAKNRYSQALLNSLQKIAESQQNAEDLHQAAQQETKSLIASYTTPQFRSLYSYDPTKDLQKLDIPVLVLFGGKDTQVSVEMNKSPIEKALEKADIKYEMRIFKNANHLFQKAKTGAVSEYGKLENEFVDGFSSTIAQWIKD